jgi:hypothetical protein
VPRLRPIRAGDVDSSGDVRLEDGARGRAALPREEVLRESGEDSCKYRCAPRPDSLDLFEFRRSRAGDRVNRAEALDEAGRRSGSDPRHFGQQREGRSAPRKTPSSVISGGPPVEANRDPHEPASRIRRVGRTQHGHASIDDLENGAAYAARRETAAIEIETFDDQECAVEGPSASEKLRPETTVGDRTMEVGNGLPLDADAVTDEIVADGQRLNADLRAGRSQDIWHARAQLAYVNDYLHVDVRHDRPSIARRGSEASNESVNTARDQICGWEFSSGGRKLP